jgi:hypothetical protein
MKRWTTTKTTVAGVLVACLLCCATAEAKKGGNGGGGGGGGEDETAPLYDVLEIPLDRTGFMSDPDSGIITVTGANDTGTGYPAAFVRVRVSDRAVIASGFLPEPDLGGDVYSQTLAVNNIGTIVGYAGVKKTGPETQRPVAWDFDGTQYQLEVLPKFSPDDFGSIAKGINNLGEIVGTSDGRAVYWDLSRGQIYDLNTEETDAQGWHLTDARDINDAGQIVGYGTLNGQVRGFLLETDGQVFAVPLLGTASENVASQIDEFGRCLGWNVNSNTSRTYYWDGPGTNAVELPSVLGSASVTGMNDLGEVAGHSYIPGGEEDWVATLWGIDAAGQVSTTDLNTVVDSKWTLLYGTDCNNEGWLVVGGKRSYRGGYRWNTLLLVPRP